jgi:hypothetical protein
MHMGWELAGGMNWRSKAMLTIIRLSTKRSESHLTPTHEDRLSPTKFTQGPGFPRSHFPNKCIIFELECCQLNNFLLICRSERSLPT